MNYITRKLNSYLEKIYGLCNSKAKHAYEKKASGLHNPKTNFMYKKDFRIM